MSRRIEIELTSTRADGTWTWRAAGAKLPKGELEGSLLFAGAKVGDVVRADAEFLMDGIEILSVLAPKGARKEPERIKVLGTPRRDDEPLVTSTLAPKERRGRREGERGPRRDRGGERRPRPRRDGEEGRSRRDGSGERQDGRERRASDRPARERRPAPPPRPKPKRLRPGRVHRSAVLDALPPEQRPVAEQVLKGGIPAVRTGIEKLNEDNRAKGLPEVNPESLLGLAEQLMPALKTAEWRDRADAALADAAEVDLRDLRSVVNAADGAARDEETRALAESLRAALATRLESEQSQWLAEIEENLTEGRVVRALRVSSRPPKAGSLLPTELSSRLAAAASAALTPDTGSDRFATVIDALALAPVRAQVVPSGIPAEPSEPLVAMVTRHAAKLPAIAALFGVAPSPRPRPPRRPSATVGSAAPTESTGVDSPATESPGTESPADGTVSAGDGGPSALETEELHEVRGSGQDEIARLGDGPGVPSGESEADTGSGGAESVVSGVAEEESL